MIDKILEKLEDRWGYLAYVDNWHKHPWISKIMCKLGRHDYESSGDVLTQPNGEVHVQLYCFYCPHRKISITGWDSKDAKEDPR